MADSALDVEIRERKGKGVARQIRGAGKVPAVLYGRGKPSLAVSLDPRKLERVLRGSDAGLNTLIDLRFHAGEQSGERVVLVKEIQREPIRGAMLHVDFYEVDLTQTVSVEVPIHLVGKAKGVEFGGVVEHSLREVEIECLPRAIPDSFEADISGMDIGDVLHVRDLPLQEGVSLLSDPELAVVLVATPAAEEAPAEEVAEGEEVPAEAAPEAAGEPEAEKSS